MITNGYILSVLENSFSQAGLFLALVVGALVVAVAALMGLGYGISKLAVWITGDYSVRVGGFYLANTPYKGYSRWHSQKWNMDHTM